MRVTVCELHDESGEWDDDWRQLVEHVRTERPQLLLLPEMSFCPWLFRAQEPDKLAWDGAQVLALSRMNQLPELGPVTVLGTGPTTRAGVRLNEGYAWLGPSGPTQPVHAKYYLPDEPDFWEATWYQRGPNEFRTTTTPNGAIVGFLICTELWFPERGRQYGDEGAHIIVTPRSTWASRYGRWLTGARALSIISGCFSLSSCKVDSSVMPESLGGHGWVIAPDGDLLAETSESAPIVTVDLDLELAAAAKLTYPRDVKR